MRYRVNCRHNIIGRILLRDAWAHAFHQLSLGVRYWFDFDTAIPSQITR